MLRPVVDDRAAGLTPINGQDPEAMVALGIALSREGQHEEAVRVLSSAAKRWPQVASVRGDLAMALYAAGQLEEAMWGFSEVLRLDPRSAQAQCGLGLAYQRLERWREAADAFRLTESLAPDQAVGPFNLGLVLRALGETEEARRALVRAASLAPDDDEIREALASLSSSPAASDLPAPLPRFRGDLESFALPEVLEFMRVQGKTGSLVISSRQGAGIVRLVRGRLTSASAPGVRRLGETSVGRGDPSDRERRAALQQIVDALVEMLSWRQGAFSFHPAPESDVPSISFDTQNVVMQVFGMTDGHTSRSSFT